MRTIPLKTIYCATKHGVKALCEGLRLELRREPGEYHVTIIAPPAINTPLFEQARSKLGAELAPPRPIFDPRIVAETIVFAAEHPRRDIFIGATGKLFDLMQRLSPSFTDWCLTRIGKIFKEQVAERPQVEPDNLFQPPPGPRRVRGRYGEEARSTSLYTRTFEWHPALKPLALGAAAIGALTLIGGLARSRNRLAGKFADAARGAVKSLG